MRCLMLTGRSMLPFSNSKFGIHPEEIRQQNPGEVKKSHQAKIQPEKTSFQCNSISFWSQ